MSLKTLIKKWLISILPEEALIKIKKSYYPWMLKNKMPDSDIQATGLFVSPGDAVVDIGCNIGSYTKYLSKLVGSNGSVLSIEPVCQTFEILTSNVKKLKLRNVTTFNYAMSDSDGLVCMEIPKDKYGNKNFYESRITTNDAERGLNKFEVKTKTLDSILSPLKTHNLSFIKCDVEGHELQVLRGASNIIKKFKPVWLIEISGNPDDRNSAAYHTFDFLKTYGYETLWFNGNKLKKRTPGDASINYFFLQPEHLKQKKLKDILDNPEINFIRANG